MRLCVVTETYPPEVNGVAHTVRHLVEGLRGRGQVVVVVRPRQRGDAGASGDVLVSALPLPRYAGLQVGLPAPRVLRTAWRQQRPDAVYVATEGPLGWSAARAAARLGIPAVSGFHTNFHRYMRHYGGAWLQRPTARYLRAFHERTAATLVATPELRHQLHADGYRNVHVLGRGVDTSLFSPVRRSTALRHTWGARDDDVVALYVGRLACEKNVPLAMDAYRAMRYAEPRLRLVVVGDGPLRSALTAAHPDVRFCGLKRGEALATHYASADVMLFPSETETFGNVVLEALASGLIVLAYDYAAARAHVRHGDNGILAPYGRAPAFVHAALAIARDAPKLGGMRVRARETALGLDWPRIVDRFEWLLADAVKAAGSASPGSTGTPPALRAQAV